MSGAPGPRSVSARADLRQQQMSADFRSYGLRGSGAIVLDPFLNLDDFVMSAPTFRPHPHAGFSAVTYMFEDSPGSFVNRDSLGDRSIIEPGALHWTQAARGMMHEEVPEVPGRECHGLQMFVNLRGDHKQADPRAFHVSAAEVPEAKPGPGVRVRVLAGAFADATSPLHELLTPVFFADLHLAPGAFVELPAATGSTAFALVVKGNGTTLSGRSEIELAAHSAVGFAHDGDRLQLRGGERGLELLVGIGAPLGEPVVFGGPFAMTNRQELREAQERFERGEMGRLDASF